MRAWTLYEPRSVEKHPLRLEDRPVPEPGPDQVRIRVTRCGVCHTDLHVVEGELPPVRLPVVPGHQVVGRIDAIGPQAVPLPSGLAVGERAGVPWLFQACGACEYCARGQENLCQRALFTGYHADGGYAEYMLAPSAFLVRLPDRYSDAQAAPLLCAGIIGYRSLKVAGVQPGDKVALFGFGASAHLTLQVAVAWGCDVAVFSRSTEHRALAVELKAAWAGQAGETAPFEADAAITFAPAGSVIPHALRAVRRGGTVAVNAVHLDGIPALEYSLLYHERRLVSVSNSTRADAGEFMRLADRLRLSVHVDELPFAQAGEALVRIKAARTRGALVLDMERR